MKTERMNKSMESVKYLFRVIHEDRDGSSLFTQCGQLHGDKIVAVSTYKYTVEAREHINNILPVSARQHFKDAINNGKRVKNRTFKDRLEHLGGYKYGESAMASLVAGLCCVFENEFKHKRDVSPVAEMLVAIRATHPKLLSNYNFNWSSRLYTQFGGKQNG